MSKHKWEFSARFRRHAFGWRSNVPMQRIKEALSEIRKEARKNPVIAAEGAILLLEKLSPSLSHVDSSSGAIGSAVYNAIEVLVPIIAKPVVAIEVRQQWLERLWDALQDDDIPYIEHLEYFWGKLCATSEMASDWADKFIPVIKQMWEYNSGCFEFFKGTIPCFSALFAAKRYDELLTLLHKAPYKSWHFREWGIKALVALNKPNDALKYAEDSHGLNVSTIAISRACEEILLSMGMVEDAYQRFPPTYKPHASSAV